MTMWLVTATPCCLNIAFGSVAWKGGFTEWSIWALDQQTSRMFEVTKKTFYVNLRLMSSDRLFTLSLGYSLLKGGELTFGSLLYHHVRTVCSPVDAQSRIPSVAYHHLLCAGHGANGTGGMDNDQFHCAKYTNPVSQCWHQMSSRIESMYLFLFLKKQTVVMI